MSNAWKCQSLWKQWNASGLSPSSVWVFIYWRVTLWLWHKAIHAQVVRPKREASTVARHRRNPFLCKHDKYTRVFNGVCCYKLKAWFIRQKCCQVPILDGGFLRVCLEQLLRKNLFFDCRWLIKNYTWISFTERKSDELSIVRPRQAFVAP